MSDLYLTPVDWETARQFCGMWHRSHKRPPAGHKFSTGLAVDRTLVGVAIVGRPSSRVVQKQEPFTLEVTRNITDGYKNACSMLLGACARGAFAMGYTKVITYNQEGESGASLRAAGYVVIAERPARAGWDCPSRPRDDHGVDGIPRTLWGRVA
jgi:hypothetical protein